MKPTLRIAVMAGLVVIGLCTAALAQTETLKSHVAALKESLTQNRQNLKQYQWTQTTVVLHKGEEKSKKVYSAHYGPDGTIQKTEVAASPEHHPGGVRGHIIEKKKEEMVTEMKQAADMMKQYVPPEPARIQAAVNSGNASVEMLEPGKKVRLNFRNYQKPGDTLAIDLDPSNHRLLGVNVSTYMDDPKDPVALAVQFGTLPDGTTYPSETTLNLKSKDVTVVTTNSDYTKMTR